MSHSSKNTATTITDEATAILATKTAQREVARHGWRVLAILSALMGFTSISTDLYLPAMPAMAQSLKTDPGMIDWTISGYLIGFCIGQLFWGPIGDRYGRRKPVAIGLVFFVIGSAGCALAGDVWSMIGWRVIQALGACASVVLARAMVRDLYEGERAARMLSNLMTVMAIAPLLGPIAGSQILAFAGWRAIFWALVVIGIATLAALMTLPETLPARRRNREPLSRALADYIALLAHRRLLAYTGAGACFYGAVFAYIAGTPFAYITYYHVSPQLYGFLFGLGIVGIMVTNVVNSRLVMKTGAMTLLLRGTMVVAVSSVVIAVAAKTNLGGLMGLVIPLFILVSMNGFIVANSIAGALSDFPERAGAVSALVGSAQYGSGIFSTALVGAFTDGTPWPMAAVIVATGLGGFLCAKSLASKPLTLTEGA